MKTTPVHPILLSRMEATCKQAPKRKRSSKSKVARMTPIPEYPRIKPSSWLRQFSEWSSMHGLPWYSRTTSPTLKTCILIVILAVLIALPAVVIDRAVSFHKDHTVRNAVEWKTASNITYPSITICNSKFFEKSRLQAFNISDDLASYMILPLKNQPLEMIRFSQNYYSTNLTRRLRRLDDELNFVMERHGFSDILDLFLAVAIRCESFVTFCEAHTQYYVTRSQFESNQNYPMCCTDFFDPVPMFTMSGTCYTSKAKVVENFPSVYSAIRVWLMAAQENMPVFSMDVLGTDATERTGMLWTLSYQDHPARKLALSPKKLALGVSTIVSVSMQITDRTKLDEPCLSVDNKDFEDRYGMQETQLNCYLTGSHYFLHNCTTGVYAGLKRVDGLKTCMPNDALSVEACDRRMLSEVKTCPHDCIRTEFPMEISSGEYDPASLEKFLIADAVARNGVDAAEVAGTMANIARQSSMLTLYFDSFDYPTYTFYQEGTFDLLSKIGGWMSLAIGGSIISLLELIFFTCYLLCIMTREVINKTKKKCSPKSVRAIK